MFKVFTTILNALIFILRAVYIFIWQIERLACFIFYLSIV